MAENINVNMDIDSLLDGTLDDLADLPEFKPFNPGVHKCVLKMEVKKVNEFQAVEVGLKLQETIEVPSGGEPMVPGAETNVLYFLTHSTPKVAELGQGKFKELMKSLAEHFGVKSNRELIADANGAEVLVTTSLRKNKDKTKEYTDIVNLVVC